jgi:uncharacterized protein (DUF2249 family)
VIRAGDRVAAVLARDERLVKVFTSLSPAFERLHKPAMRKVMARLVTIEQAARMAGIEPELLLGRLNDELRSGEGEGAPVAERTGVGRLLDAQRPETHEMTESGDRGDEVEKGPGEQSEMESGRSIVTVDGAAGMPPVLAAVPAELIIDLDVRPDLRRGEEPFSKIMAARRELPPGGVLRLRATFEPVPLYAVMAKQGFEHWTEELAEDDWRVSFYPPTAESDGDRVASGAEPAVAEAGATPADLEDDVVVLDVRNLEPPEPMMRTFAALEELPPGKTLLQINVRVPQFLLPQLAERGFTYEIREQSRDLVRIFIRHKVPAEGQ